MPEPSSEPLSWKPPTLSIDFRSGSVVMLLDSGEAWAAPLTLNSVDRSQINTPHCRVESSTFVKLPALEG